MGSISSSFGRVSVDFFRDEYQDSIGNLSHIHALTGMHRGNLSEVLDLAHSLITLISSATL